MKIEDAPKPRSERHERLLDAAAALFARWGFDKTSVEDIAREAGVSKGAVYLEFANKDALFRTVVRRELTRYARDWSRRLSGDPAEWSFARMFQHSVAAIEANPLVKALVTRDQRIYGSFLRRDREFMEMTLSLRAELFDQMQACGAVRDDIPASVLAYLLSVLGYGMLTGAEIIPDKHRVPFHDALGALGLLLDRGLSPPEGANRQKARELLMTMVEKVTAALDADAPGNEPDPGHQSSGFRGTQG